MRDQKCKWFFAAVLGAVLCGCTPKEPVIQTRFLFDTVCKITVPASENNAVFAVNEAFNRAREIHEKFNVLNSSSPLYAFNHYGTPIRDSEVAGLVTTAFKIREESGGAFDPTVYPLVMLWGFYSDTPALPEKNAIKNDLALTGPDAVRLEKGKVYALKNGAGLDLAGVVSGYAADEALKVLKKNGIKSALIDMGGEIYALGSNNGRKWKVGLKDPRGEGIIGIIELENEAVVTGGDYEKYFMVNGKRYCHILDPKTGYPAEGMQSVSVLHPLTVIADGWSTAFFVLGAEKGFEIVNKKAEFKVLAVTGEGKLIGSFGTKKQFTLKKIGAPVL